MFDVARYQIGTFIEMLHMKLKKKKGGSLRKESQFMGAYEILEIYYVTFGFLGTSYLACPFFAMINIRTDHFTK